MDVVYSAYPLYEFLNILTEHPGEKRILDCGAGGLFPKLGLFADEGFECYGIEIDKCRLKSAIKFAEKRNLKLTLIHGDMKKIPYGNEYFDAVYSWNSIFHLPKRDIQKSIRECIRVMKPGAWLFINLLSEEDGLHGKGEKVGNGEFISEEEDTLHSFFSDDEADSYFKPLKLYKKSKRREKLKINGDYEECCYIDYIFRKLD